MTQKRPATQAGVGGGTSAQHLRAFRARCCEHYRGFGAPISVLLLIIVGQVGVGVKYPG